jgi:hypothetical protein
MGTYSDFTEEDSQSYTEYNWVKIKGADGADGSDGIDGDSSFIHIAYSSSPDGSIDFSTSVFDDALYIGTYGDNMQKDSESYTDYN